MCNMRQNNLSINAQQTVINYYNYQYNVITVKANITYFVTHICMLFPFLNIFIDYAITVVPFPPSTPLHPAHPLPPTFPPYSSCPWSILISSLASTFPTLFLPSSCLFSTYHLC